MSSAPSTLEAVPATAADTGATLRSPEAPTLDALPHDVVAELVAALTADGDDDSLRALACTSRALRAAVADAWDRPRVRDLCLASDAAAAAVRAALRCRHAARLTLDRCAPRTDRPSAAELGSGKREATVGELAHLAEITVPTLCITRSLVTPAVLVAVGASAVRHLELSRVMLRNPALDLAHVCSMHSLESLTCDVPLNNDSPILVQPPPALRDLRIVLGTLRCPNMAPQLRLRGLTLPVGSQQQVCELLLLLLPQLAGVCQQLAVVSRGRGSKTDAFDDSLVRLIESELGATLEDLRLEYTSGTVGPAPRFDRLPNLRRVTLRLVAVGIDDTVRLTESAMSFSQLGPHVERLALLSTAMPDDVMRGLAASPAARSLRELRLRASHRDTDWALLGADVLRRLERVEVSRRGYDDEPECAKSMLGALAEARPVRLRKLVVHGQFPSHKPPAGLSELLALPSTLRGLRSLKLYNTSLTDPMLRRIIRLAGGSLRRLTLSGNSHLSVASLRELGGLSRLIKLNLQYVVDVDDMSSRFIQLPRTLRVLSVASCYRLGAPQLAKLIETVPRLRVLHLDGMSSLCNEPAFTAAIASTSRLSELSLEVRRASSYTFDEGARAIEAMASHQRHLAVLRTPDAHSAQATATSLLLRSLPALSSR